MKHTKKALFMSALSMLLCLTMLVGSTFAWFTDTVTAGRNKIVAGNLDMELEYATELDADNNPNWQEVTKDSKLFDDEARWEPGRTEVVYLKVKNVGSLAFNYFINVSPVNEVGGINVNGDNFKLSDSLVFATTAPSETFESYTRDSARAAAGEATGLNQEVLKKENTIALESKKDQYLAVIVYMPERIGNEANYKSGTEAPSIDLGITFVATQASVETEKDSFGHDYDVNAEYPKDSDSINHTYKPQISEIAPMTKTEEGNVSSTNKNVSSADGMITISSTQKIDNTGKPYSQVSFPSLAVGDGEVWEYNVSPKTEPSTKGITVTDDEEAETFDISVTVKKDGAAVEKSNVNHEVSLYIGKGKSGVKLYHGISPVEAATYDSATGYINFTTTHFSEFTVVCDKPVASIGSTSYYSFDEAVAAAKAGDTVTLTKDMVADKTYAFNNGAVLDAKGHTITVKTLNPISGDQLTIKNAVFEKADKSVWGIATGSIAYDKCTFNSMSPYITPNVGKNITVKNCVFNNTMLQICWGEGEQAPANEMTTTITGNTFNYTAENSHGHAIALNGGSQTDYSKVEVSGNTFNNKGVAAYSALYITSAETASTNYSGNTENNASMGYLLNGEFVSKSAENGISYLNYETSGNKVLYVVSPDYASEVCNVPKGVTSIGGYAFAYNKNIKEIVLPSTVKTLESRAFRGTSAETVRLNEGLTSIGESAFRDAKITSITIPSTVTHIGKEAFRLCGLTSLVVPATVETIEHGAFRDIKELTTVTIEGNLAIPVYAFRTCPKLTNVYLNGNDVKFSPNDNGTYSMVFTHADTGASDGITIYVKNETVKTRVIEAQKSANGYTIEIVE